MKLITLKDIKDHIGEEVKLRGWVRNYRKSSSKLRFIIFRDAHADIQAVAFKPEMGEENFEKVKQVSLESSVEMIGIPTEHPKREDVFEFQLKDINIIGKSENYPIGKKEHGADNHL